MFARDTCRVIRSLMPGLSFQSRATGVGHAFAVSASPLPCVELVEPGSCALGVGQYEQSFALMRRADFFRRKQTRLNAVTQASKVIVDLLESQS